MEKEENILGTEKIGKLIKKFAVPSIISLVVNSLYNIVDQIFIGWATNIIFPLTVVCLAFALCFGDGASAYLSLKLGEKKKKEASKGVANSIVVSIIIAVALCAISLIFLPQLLNIFGCTDALREYATEYGYIIVMGLPFMMIGTTLNSVIRADGSPKYAMASMLAGAILNIILDPIFIFVFNMGVAGAAIATVISQILGFIINIAYLKRLKSIELNKDDFKVQPKVAIRVASLGISSFITQMSIVVVVAVQNNLLRKYGVNSRFGAEIPITVFGIVMKISQIVYSIIIGVAAGSQPILGYNYGAGKYDRVKQTLKTVLTINVVISIISFILYQTIPDKLISIFGSGDSNYMEFACMTFRTYLMLCVFNGVQISSGIFFQAIGKSAKSAILSLSRQIIILVPAFFMLGHLFGIEGILCAGPVADGIAFAVATTLLVFEMKNLGKNKRQTEIIVDNTNIDSPLENHVIITIAREYGSGGRYVGKLISDKLGINLYDKNFIIKVAEKTGLSTEYIENNEQKRSNLAGLNNGYYTGLSNEDELFVKEAEVIKELSEKQSCVIIGRCADFVLKDRPNIIKVFIYSNKENKIKRATEIYGLDKKNAEKEITKINKLRANHYKHYTGNEWNSPENYDICVNSDTLGVEKTAEIICEMTKNKALCW